MAQKYSSGRDKYQPWGCELDVYVPLSAINKTLNLGKVKTYKDAAVIFGKPREVVVALPTDRKEVYREDADNVFITAPPSAITKLQKKYESLTPEQRIELEDVYVSWNGPAMRMATKVEIMTPKLGQKRRIRYLISERKEK